MMRTVLVTFVLTWLSGGACAQDLLPWQTENIGIPLPGKYSVPIDDREILFEVPEGDGFSAGQAIEVITRGGGV